jgi:methionyl-tRNA formyltransferase
MRLAFLGTPEAAVPTLRALLVAGHDVPVVVTRPDRRRGRGGALSQSPVKVAAMELGLRVSERIGDVIDLGLDLGVVVAYGAMIRANVLDELAMLNVHFSLLPRWRGAAPVQRAILAGDTVTGVSVMSLEEQLDTGPVHLQRRVDIEEKRLSELTTELAQVGAAALVEVLATPSLLGSAHAQEGETTYAEKLTKEDLHLSPSMDVATLLRVVRLERAFTFIEGRRLGVLRAHPCENMAGAEGAVSVGEGRICLVAADGAIALDEVKPEGSKVMTSSAWWAGARLHAPSAQWS